MSVKTAVRRTVDLLLLVFPLFCVAVVVLSLGDTFAFAQDADRGKGVKGGNYPGVPG